MKLPDLSIRRPVAVIMLFFIVLLLGSVSMSKLNTDLLPQMNLPMALAIVEYPGVGPDEVETLVTRPLESALGTVGGIENIHSFSSMGSSVVYMEFSWDTDMDYALNQMREKLDLIIPMLPADAKKPMLFKLDPNMMPVMVLGFGGEYDLSTLDILANDVVKPRLERINGVASVSVEGGIPREIRVSLAPQRLLAYGLTFDQIIAYLRAENRSVSVGTVEEGLREHTVRVTGEFSDIREIEDLRIPLGTGSSVRLGDLASVEDTFKDQNVLIFMDGMPSVQISVQKQTDANTVKVSAAVNEALEELKKELPGDTFIKTGFDQADFIRISISNVTQNAFWGAALAVLVLLLFLRNIRSTLIIGISIPFSVISTFILMYFGGLTLNMVSLGGLALGVGMMVDNSIVILENIYRYRQEGFSRLEAAVLGAEEVGSAVLASTLTTVVVFLPIVFVEGLSSQVFRPLALTVTFSLFSSLLVALTLVPMLSSKVLKVEQGNGNAINGCSSEENSSGGSGGDGIKKKGRLRVIHRLSGKWAQLLKRLDYKYRTALGWSINNKKKVVLGTLALFILSLALLPFVGMEFMPQQDTGEYVVNISLPNGVALRETQRVTELVESFIRETPEHEWNFYAIGASGGIMSMSSGPEQATISGRLVDKSKRKRSTEEVLDEIRKKCEVIPGAVIELSVQGINIGSAGTPIEIRLTGDNLEVLAAFAGTVAERVKTIEGTREVKTSLEEGRPELHLKLNREKADLYGINVTQFSSFLATAVKGTVATRYRVEGDEIDVTVILAEKYRRNLNDLRALTVRSQTGALVELGDIADFETATGPTGISRTNQARLVSVTGDIVGRDLYSVTQDIQAALSELNVPRGVMIEYGGANKEMVEAFNDLALALAMAVILVYMIMAAQYESFLYPFVIMFSMPPMIIGVILSLFVTGRTLNIASFIGVIMLAGIVVNNAIVLVDYINVLRRRDGMPRVEAILKAGATRLRPILMTTLTTVLALVPLVLGLGEGSELSAPMATVVFGGLTFSTMVTLLLVPCMYLILEDVVAKMKRTIFRTETRVTGGRVNG